MGQFISWIRGPRDNQGLQDVAVEEQSQPKQATPTPAAQVSKVKPAQYEKGADSATTADTASKTATSSVSAMAAPSTTTTKTPSTTTTNPSQKPDTVGPTLTAKTPPSPKPTPSTTTTTITTPASKPATVGSTSTATSDTKPKVAARSPTTPVTSAPAPAPVTIGSSVTASGGASAGAAASAAPQKGSPEVKPQSTTVPSGKSEPAKKAPAGVSKPSAPAGAAAPKGLDAKAKELKVQAELKAPAAKAAVQELDPFEALAGSLPPSEPLAPKAPVYTGPEVKEPHVTSEEGVLCGERDDTLPPGYRLEDMAKKMPAGVPDKPKETPKPMSTDEALDSLSAGFGFSPDPVKDKMETVESASTAAKNFAPLPPPAQKSAAPPLDKKAKMEKPAQDFSLEACLSTPPAKTDKLTTDEGVPMSLDALSALEDTLPAHVPEPEPPKLRPEDIVKAPKVKSEDAVRVGERDDTLPPDYRFTEEELQKYPAPKPEPTLDTDAALDLLSGDFVTPAASANVQAPVPPSAPKQSAMGQDALDALAGDFAGFPEIAVCPAPPSKPTAPGPVIAVCPPGPDPAVIAVCPPGPDPAVIAVCPPGPDPAVGVPLEKPFICKYPAPEPGILAPKETAVPVSQSAQDFSLEAGLSSLPENIDKPKTDEGFTMSLDALSALEDTLPAHVPEPEPPKLRPEDIVKAPKVKSEDAVRVGERDDTLPPDYRFTEEDLQKYPAPKPEPTLDTDAALDLLSGDFVTPAASANVQAPVPPSAPKQSVEELDALDALAGDFAGCHAPELAVCPPLNTAVLKPDEIAVCPPGPDPAVLAVCPPANTAVLHPDELAAMDALSDLLPDSAPAPAPVPIPTKDIVQEKKVEEEKIIKMGERDDTLPPEFRLSEEEKEAMKKAAADAKPEKPSMDNATALDLLADDFSDPVAPTAAIPAETALKTKSVAPPAQQEPCIVAPGPVLDELASTLIPSTLEARPKETRSKGKSGKSKSKSKKHAAAEDPTATLDLAGPAGTNVVSTKKGGKS